MIRWAAQPSRSARHLTTRRLRLVSDELLEVNLDGEIAAVTPATFEVDRNALHVVVPAHSLAARMDDVPVSSAPPHTPASRPD